MDADEPRKKPAVIVVGESLDVLGLTELESRVADLEAEIRRVKAEIDKKRSSKLLADGFFKI
jgi:uncharacterized small protein (DUF1192 family)